MTRVKLGVTVALIITLAVITAVIGWADWLNWLVFLSVACGIFTCLYGAEGKWYCFIFQITSYAIYIPFCLMTHYYGELATSIIVIIANTVTLFKWRRNTNATAKVVQVNALTVRELLIVLFAFIGAIIGWMFALRAIGTADPLLNAICTIATITGIYFGYRIHRFEFVCAFIYNLSMISLWLLAGLHGDIGLIIFAFGALVEIGFAIYGFIYWKQLYRKQHGVTL